MRRPRLTYANAVSTLCLFLLLGGGAWAASTQLPKNSVGTKQLKPNAVTGAKVKDGSLTGADIQASTLGTVPKATSAATATTAGHATSADTAGHADSATNAGHATSVDSAPTAGDAGTLDGLGPGAFYAAAGSRRIDGASVDNGPELTLYDANGLTLVAFCGEPVSPNQVVLNVGAVSVAPGARIDTGLLEREGATERPVIGEQGLSSEERIVWATHGVKGGSAGQSVGTMTYTDAGRSIAFTLESRVATNGSCQISGTSMVSG